MASYVYKQILNNFTLERSTFSFSTGAESSTAPNNVCWTNEYLKNVLHVQTISNASLKHRFLSSIGDEGDNIVSRNPGCSCNAVLLEPLGHVKPFVQNGPNILLEREMLEKRKENPHKLAEHQQTLDC